MSKVYFIAVDESDDIACVRRKTALLLDESKVLGCIDRDDRVAVKIHFGEEGNAGHVRPEYAAAICEKIKLKGARPFLTDTNALYKGERTVSSDHIKLAGRHGFTKAACGADIIIPDDTKIENVLEVPVNGSFIRKAKIAAVFLNADAIVDVAHFKGHLMTGFGGALKNIGMGCAAREGKLAQHSDITPIIHVEDCTGCMACVKACPADAIYIKADKAYIDPSKCIGCATCIAACANKAIDVDWEAGGSQLQEKMIEYASAVLNAKKKKSAFINFAVKITKECDCLAKDDPRVCPDIGIFASEDPVAVDTACYDAVTDACGKDIFKMLHPKRDGRIQLDYAQKMGLGDQGYKLIKVDVRAIV